MRKFKLWKMMIIVALLGLVFAGCSSIYKHIKTYDDNLFVIDYGRVTFSGYFYITNS